MSKDNLQRPRHLHRERRGRVWAIVLILGGSIYYTWAKHIESLPSYDYDRVPMEKLEEGVGEKREERLKA